VLGWVVLARLLLLLSYASRVVLSQLDQQMACQQHAGNTIHGFLDASLSLMLAFETLSLTHSLIILLNEWSYLDD